MPISLLAVLGQGLLDPDTPIAAADDLGLTRGDGCFEGCRFRRLPDGTAVMDKPEAHLARLGRSATSLEIPVDEPGWRALIDLALAAWAASEPGESEAVVKLVLTRGRPEAATPTAYLTVSPMTADIRRQRRDGVAAITLSRGFTADAFAAAPWLLGGVKTLSYAVNMAAQREAARRGAEDSIYVSVDGQVLECPTSAVVWSLGDTLHTVADGATGILGSTTMHLLFERAEAAGWKTVATAATVADLRAADAVFLVSSVRGVIQVVSLDGRPLPVTDAGRAVLQASRMFTDFA